MIYRKQLYKEFLQWSVISAVVILGPMIAIDSSYYGTLVLAPWNIIKYNVLGGAGPELYGTEPFSFYLMNGFLNFNIIWVKLFHIVQLTCVLNFLTDFSALISDCITIMLSFCTCQK